MMTSLNLLRSITTAALASRELVLLLLVVEPMDSELEVPDWPGATILEVTRGLMLEIPNLEEDLVIRQGEA